MSDDETKYYVDGSGVYLGGFSGSEPDGGIEVATPPDYADQLWDGTEWAYSKAQLKSILASKRYDKEIGGITLYGLPVPTDDRAKLLIAGKYSKAIEDDDPSIEFVAKIGGAFMPLTNAQIVEIFNAVNIHVQKCFTAESVVYAAIDDETVLTSYDIQPALDTAYDEA